MVPANPGLPPKYNFLFQTVGSRTSKLISVSTWPCTRQYSGSPPPAGIRVAEVMVVLSRTWFARLVQSAVAFGAHPRARYRPANPRRNCPIRPLTGSQITRVFGIFIVFLSDQKHALVTH